MLQISVTFDLENPAWRVQAKNLMDTLVTAAAAEFDITKDAVIEKLDEAATTTKANRQQAAANARAAKAAKTGQTPVEDVLGPADGPEDQAPQAEDLGLADPSMSPAEAKEAGLALVRECYAAGKVAEVKALQKEWQVAKFYDVPIPRGHEFYQRVMKMAVETGIRK